MPIETKKLANLPIVVATFIGHTTVADVEQMYEETERLLADAGEKYYRISDVRQSDTNFPDFMKIIAAMRQDGKFRTSDPNMQVVFVGTNLWIHNYRNMAQRKGIEIPAFNTFTDAITYIKLDMDEQKEE